MSPQIVKRWLGNRAIRRAAGKQTSRRLRRRPRFFRPFLEILEERILLSTLVVNNPTDTTVDNEICHSARPPRPPTPTPRTGFRTRSPSIPVWAAAPSSSRRDRWS